MRKYIIENGVLFEYKGQSAKPIIPKDVTVIGVGAFADCDTITSIKIPSNVTKIDNCAFRDCENLSSINIPNSVTHIGYAAFSRCESLTSIELPNSVTHIGDFAFSGCNSLAHIKIPNSVSYISFCAFSGIKPIKRTKRADGKIIAFKGFHEDWTCRGFQYEIGKSYHLDGNIICCGLGFHACPNPLDIFNYYRDDLDKLHFAEVELSGEMDWYNDKVAASDIRIIRELTVSELADIYNSMEKC